jgi:predicted AAA+ superfamily ATPase
MTTAKNEAELAPVGRFFRAPSTHYFLFGPRGTGKSTWLREAYPDALWVDLLRPEEQRLLAARPERLRELVAGNPRAEVVVIDEVQKVPALLDVVHELVERRPEPRFVLTGSSAWIDYSEGGRTLSFWRTKAGTEVDFVVYGPGGFWALEVKQSATVRAADLRGLKAFRDDYPEATLRLLYRGDDSLEVDGIRCVPCDAFLRHLVPGEPLP